MSMKNSNDTIRNRTLNLPACSAVFNQLRPRVPEEEEDRVLSMLSEWWGGVCVSAFNFIWTVFTKLYADHTPFRKFPHCFAWLDCDWNVLAHAQKPDFVFRAKRTSPFKSARRGCVSSVDCWQPSCAASAVVMLDTSCSEVVWRVLATHCIPQFPLHFPSRASPCAVTFQLYSTSCGQ